jgi:hypothetical protein
LAVFSKAPLKTQPGFLEAPPHKGESNSMMRLLGIYGPTMGIALKTGNFFRKKNGYNVNVKKTVMAGH